VLFLSIIPYNFLGVGFGVGQDFIKFVTIMTQIYDNDEVFRPLTEEEIAALISTGCTARDWGRVLVSEKFTPGRILNTRFSGDIRLGSFEGEFALPGGVVKPAGIHSAALHNCRIADGVLIDGVHNYIANYDIGEGSRIENVNLIVCEGRSAFGNEVQVAVLNETGGREVPVYDNLSASLAYVIAMYRHRPRLVERLREMITGYAASIASERGTIGRGVTIVNTSTIRNVRIGDRAVIENCTRLENGSVNSNATAPVYIGDSVIAEDFIISSGATVSDAAKLVRCFVGQACRVSVNYMAHDSLLFSNCSFENGEACAIFAGPFTVSMHKSSLLIAGMFSFLNAGSGSNQSNHLYKLGPIHQGIVERGSKTTSDSYILWPARVGAFSLVMGRHYHHSDTSDMPFSYLIEQGDESWLVPGVNLRSVGTIRDAQKWPRRDRRQDPHRLDMINYNLLSPWTVCRMMKAVKTLKELQAAGSEMLDGMEAYRYQNTLIRHSALVKALGFYDMAISKFMGNSIIKRLEGTSFRSIEQVRDRLAPTEPRGRGEWLDLSGLFIPKAELERMMDAIEKGEMSLSEVEEFFREIHDSYYEMEWTWVCEQWEACYGVKLSEITAEQIVGTVRRWQSSVTGLDEMLYEDARKEFSLSVMTGFGVDGSERDKQLDFEFVRGDFETN
jgi:carbonic anhydrase/acetyltransferase-like protein (isoleucine patch superfamily)